MKLVEAEQMVERLVSRRVGWWDSEATDRLSDGDLITLWGVLVQKRLLLLQEKTATLTLKAGTEPC